MARKKELKYECDSCGGTGVYSGFAEPKGVAVVCLRCDGTGEAVFSYYPFEGRKKRRGIKTVRRSRGTFIATGVGPTGHEVPYREFVKGKFPK